MSASVTRNLRQFVDNPSCVPGKIGQRTRSISAGIGGFGGYLSAAELEAATEKEVTRR